MRRYKLLEMLYKSFYIKDAYRDAARNWEGFGFLYLLAVIALLWLAGITKIAYDFDSFISPESTVTIGSSGRNLYTFLELITEELPPLTIRNGQFFTEAEQPHTISDPETGEPVLIIDTTGSIRSLKETAALALITKNAIILKGLAGEEPDQAIPIPEWYEVVIDGDMFRQIMEKPKTLIFMMYPVVVMGYFAIYALRAFLFALLAMIFALGMKIQVPYRTLVRLTCVALTPVIALKILTASLQTTLFAFPDLVFLALTVFYTYAAVEANRAPELTGERDKVWE